MSLRFSRSLSKRAQLEIKDYQVPVKVGLTSLGSWSHIALSGSSESLASGIDLWKIMDVAEDVVRPLILKPVRIGKASLTMGYAGVYSSFLLHAGRAAEQFGVDERDILVEIGKRKAVGGQEDMIVEIAMALAEKQKERA